MVLFLQLSLSRCVVRKACTVVYAVDLKRMFLLVTKSFIQFAHVFLPPANVDYTPRGPFEITFPAGNTRQEYTVNIFDDLLPENSEFFNADIVSAGPAGVIIGEPRQPFIEILDTVTVESK